MNIKIDVKENEKMIIVSKVKSMRHTAPQIREEL